jgi:tetratricopeptide (TPR) repeat protein
LTKTARGLALMLMLTLAACGNRGGLGALGGMGGMGGVSNLLSGPAIAMGDKTFAPGVDRARDGIDGLMVGHRLMASGEYELALKAYLRAASQQGATVDVLSALGSANLALGRLGQAEQILRRAIEQDPSFVPAQNNLGVVLMEAGKVGEARAVFQRAYALDSGKTDEIRENLKQAIAESEKTIYGGPEVVQKPPMALVRRGQGSYVLLSQF